MGSPVHVSHCSQPSCGGCQTESPSYFSHPTQVWKCYVDDTCSALATSEIDRFQRHTNSMEPHIQLTVEIETDGQFPFLDLLLRCEEDGSISNSVYRKPMHTDRYLDFSSHHP